PRHRPSASTTGAPLMLDRESKRAASRSDISCGMVITCAVIRSAAVKARSGLVAVCIMVDLLQGELSGTGRKSRFFGEANPVPANLSRPTKRKAATVSLLRRQPLIRMWLRIRQPQPRRRTFDGPARPSRREDTTMSQHLLACALLALAALPATA